MRSRRRSGRWGDLKPRSAGGWAGPDRVATVVFEPVLCDLSGTSGRGVQAIISNAESSLRVL